MPDEISPVNGNRPPPEVNHERRIREEERLRELEESDRERERSQDEGRGQNIDTYA
jgi:hypothetical protein